MKSLFLRIFLSFWLAQALFVVLAILVTVAMRPARQISAIEALQGKFLSEAVDAYQSGGPSKLREYLWNLQGTQHVHAVLFNEQGSLMGHPMPPWRGPGHQMFADVASGKQRTADTLWGRFSPHPQFLKASMTGSDGHRYTLVTELPPGQNALFGPNGVPGLGIAIAVLSSGLVCYFLAGYMTSPILRLRKATQKLASGDLSARAGQGSRSGDEMSQLVRDFDLMAEQIEKLMHAQSRLLKDISHELRSPLARLTVALELARQRTGPEAESILERISLESSRMNELIGSLTAVSRLESGAGTMRRIPVELEDLVQEVARDAAFEAQARNCQVACEVLDELPYRIDDARGRSTGGVGLGLAITDQAVRLHGGSVKASNLPEGGLLVEIRIPLRVSDLAAARIKQVPVATAKNS